MKVTRVFLFITVLCLSILNRVTAAEFALSPDDKLPVACRELLRTQDIASFTQQVCPSLQDYEAEARRFGRGLEPDERFALERSIANNILNLTRAAEQFVKTGKRFAFFSESAEWKFKGATTRPMVMTSHYIHRKGETMPHVGAIRLTFHRDNGANNSPGAGEYSIDLVFALQFPDGWRVSNGIKWSRCPDGTVPERLHGDMELAASFTGPRANFSSESDPALRAVADQIKELLTGGNSAATAEKLTYTSDLFTRISEERSPDRRLPSKQQIDDILGSRVKELIASAESLASEARRLGVDFTGAEIVEAVAEKVQIQAPAGLPELFRADDLRVTLRVPEIKSESGVKSAGGDYVIGSASAERLDGKWYLPKLRWVSMQSMTDDASTKSIELENYVTKFHRLPHGTPAPDIELLSLSPDGQRSSKLSDYRGKFVILEWWATWCGPCQAPMAKLQKVREEHPEWADQVEIITVSLDDAKATAYKHLQARAWTNTANFWAGSGFSSPAAKAFRVSAIPEIHLISTNGAIVDSDVRLSPLQELDTILKEVQ